MRLGNLILIVVSVFGGETLMAAAQSIRDIDFKSIAVKNSRTNRCNVKPALYGDLNGDGKEEAVIETLCNTGGSGQFSQAYIYTMKGGKPSLIAEVKGGDRGMGGIDNLKVVSNRLVVTKNESSVACCPEFKVTTTYKLEGKKLVAVSEPVRKKVAE